MTDFAWREELSTSFGKIMRPVAEVFVKDKNGMWRALTMYIDSGADACVMSRSFGELFGHDLEKGRSIKMLGFGEEEIRAYVHNMEFKIGDDEIKVKVAIADKDNVPNVLGRTDVFNRFEVQFKPQKQCTRFL